MKNPTFNRSLDNNFGKGVQLIVLATISYAIDYVIDFVGVEAFTMLQYFFFNKLYLLRSATLVFIKKVKKIFFKKILKFFF